MKQQRHFSKPFYFIRHGITDANEKKLWCGGDWDIDLNRTGILQASQAAHTISELFPKVDRIFSSPMKRALQTTTAINSIIQKDVVVVEKLREWKVGELERTPWTNPLLGKPITDWVNPPGGETVTQFQCRIELALEECFMGDHFPLISSHGAVGRIILQLLGIPDRHIDNCKVYKFYPSKDSTEILWQLEGPL